MTDWFDKTGEPNSPVATNHDYAAHLIDGADLQVSDEVDSAADIVDVMGAGMFSDPEAMKRFYSERMGIPIEKFQTVQGGEHSGALGYKTDNGTLQLVAPGFARGVAAGIGPAIPALGGMVGAVAGLPGGGPAGAGVGGFLGASGGQAFREAVSNVLGDQEVSPKRIATEGAIDIASTLGGVLVGKGLSRVAATRAAKSFSNALKDVGGNTARALQQTLDSVNKQYGTQIRLTPAELTNETALRAQQKALEARPMSAQIIEDYRTKNANEMDKAALGFFDEISPQIGSDAAGESLARAAGNAVDSIKAARVSQGSPAYQMAFQSQDRVLDFGPVVETLDDYAKQFPRGQSRFARVKKLLKESRGNLEVFQDNAKEELDRLIKIERKNGRAKIANALRDVLNESLAIADGSVPQYKEARRIWGELSDPVSRAEGGILPTIANTSSKDWANVGRKFFGGATPGEINRARKTVLKTEGGEDAWNATIRGFLEDTWEKSGNVALSNIAEPNRAKASQAARFWASTYGDGAQQRRLIAALGPDRFKAYKNLMDVFEATARATNFNSTTVSQAAGQKMLDDSNAARILAKAALNPFGIPGRATTALDEAASERNVMDIARIITSDDAVNELLKIRKSGGASVRNTLIAAKALNLGGQGAFGE